MTLQTMLVLLLAVIQEIIICSYSLLLQYNGVLTHCKAHECFIGSYARLRFWHPQLSG